MARLHIPTSCEANASDMTPTERGSFCAHCQKEVIDFTGMADEEIAVFFRKQRGNTCGKFRASQLDRKLEAPRKSYFRAGMMGRWMGMLSLGLPGMLVGQSVEMTPQQLEDQPLIRLQLVDIYSRKPVWQAKITLEETGQEFWTDFQGMCLLPKEVFAGDEEIRLRVTHEGYEDLLLALPQSMLNKPLMRSLRPLPHRFSFSGKVYSEGSGDLLAGAVVALRKSREEEPIVGAFTEDDGSFSFSYEGMSSEPVEDYLIEVSFVGFGMTYVSLDSVKSNEKGVFDLDAIPLEALYLGGVYHSYGRIRGFFYRLGTPFRRIAYKVRNL